VLSPSFTRTSGWLSSNANTPAALGPVVNSERSGRERPGDGARRQPWPCSQFRTFPSRAASTCASRGAISGSNERALAGRLKSTRTVSVSGELTRALDSS